MIYVGSNRISHVYLKMILFIVIPFDTILFGDSYDDLLFTAYLVLSSRNCRVALIGIDLFHITMNLSKSYVSYRGHVAA
jgi:hypothetical protein